MCGRIALYDDPDRLARLLDAGVDPDLMATWRPSWNVGPTAPILGVSERHGRRILGAYKWGLVPSWAKNPAAVTGTFNVWAESVATKPMFRSAFERRRILVPVDAFYEWQKLGPKEKQPYVFQRADGQPVVFAGLREWWRDAEGQELRSATIITTEAGPDMPIHNREPVVLEPENWDLWLDPGLTGGAELARLLAPTAAGTLVHHPVGKEVGSTRNDRPELLEPIDLDGDGGPNGL